MAHVNKGAVGVRLEFVDGVSAAGLSVSGIENVGEDQHAICQQQGLAYSGADARGITMTVAKNIDLQRDILVDGVGSSNGQAFGIEVRKAAEGMNFEADIEHVRGKVGSMDLAALSTEHASSKYVMKKVLA